MQIMPNRRASAAMRSMEMSDTPIEEATCISEQLMYSTDKKENHRNIWTISHN